ncbi:glycosyltransferase [Modestobacter sp. VKM Ac-2986]|uniref:glycosyltransferase n=1 Tax=Modestobacter sp. VKM Ac-2986 TaxID=3004140 RepID=UPI0022AB9A1E|nr:glycosyltransferase [Modestobacter sp. VKM Ac-2986]MCZ2830867.1 glycosyltransferase [Modestobacter sp. VKM Ac-2986]
MSGSPPELVSVVMIFRDAVEFFDEAIRSVLAQDHPLELLLCDDGSGPESTAIARDWAAREPARVRYLDHPGHGHQGMSSTRNLGIRAARGDLVAFLDADDVWLPGHVAHEVALLRAHPDAGLVCGQAMEWHSWRPGATGDEWTPLPWPPGTVVAVPRMLTATLRRGAHRTPTCSLMVRRSLLTEVGGAADEFPGMFEDQALLAALHTAAPAVVSGTRTALYRRHAASTTARAVRDLSYHPWTPNPSMETYLRWLEARLAGSPAGGDPELHAALETALMPYRSEHRRRPAVRSAVARVLPAGAARVVRGVARRARDLAPARVGLLRRVEPLSRQFGYDRGLPVDRHYVEQFLTEHAHLVAGRVLEVGDRDYTRRFGQDRVTRSDVLNVRAGHPETTLVGDLADGAGLPSDTFDCVVLTQTLHLVHDLPAAVRTLHRMVRPGGTVLATFPGISPVSDDEWADTWQWALTPVSARRLFGDVFGAEHVEVAHHGNVLTSAAFLYGMAAHELSARELAVTDPQFPMLITVRAVRPATPGPLTPAG